MLGFFVFNDYNTLVFFDLDKDLISHLKSLQQDYLPEASTSGFCSEKTPSPEPKEEEIKSKKSISNSGTTTLNSDSTLKTASSIDSAANNLDFNVLNQIFAPLVLLWRTKQEFDRDPYLDFGIRNGYRFTFHWLRDQHVLFCISRAEPTWKIEKYMDSVVSALDFSFGPLLSSLTHSSESKAQKRLFAKLLDSIKMQILGNSQNLQWISNSVDIAAFLDEDQAGISQTLATLALEFQVYLGSSICLLITSGRLMSAQQNIMDNSDMEGSTTQLNLQGRPKLTVLSAADTILLMQTCPKVSHAPKGGGKPKHSQVWLQEPAGIVHPEDETSPMAARQRELCQRFQWDLFRFELLPGTHLLCLGRSLGSEIVAKLSFIIDVFEALANEVQEITSLLQLIDRCINTICQELIDMIPDEIVGPPNQGNLLHNLSKTAQNIQAQWQRLKKNFQLAGLSKRTMKSTMNGTKFRNIPTEPDAMLQNLFPFIVDFIVRFESPASFEEALLKAKLTKEVLPNSPVQPLVQRQNFFLNSAYSTFSAEIDAKISALTSHLRLLMNQLVKKSQESARGYKLEMFEKCWSRLTASKLYQSQTRTLLSLIPASGFPSLSPVELNLDLLGYLFVCPARRLCFIHMNPNLDRDTLFANAAMRFLKGTSQSRTAVIQHQETTGDHLIILVTNRFKFRNSADVCLTPNRVTSLAPNVPKSPGSTSKENMHFLPPANKTTATFAEAPKRTGLRAYFKAIFKRAQDEPVSFDSIEEPVWCLGVFDPFVHGNLAVDQTRQLAALLFEKTNAVQWNFA